MTVSDPEIEDYSMTEYSFVRDSVPYKDAPESKKLAIGRILPDSAENVKKRIEALLIDYLEDTE
jgi:hypothetical protein